MALSLAGYEIRRLLRAGTRTQVLEAERKRDGRRVVAKLVDDPGGQLFARVEHELRLLADLDIDGLVRPIGVERSGERLVLLLEWIDGVALDEQFGEQPVPIARFLTIARALAAVLVELHAQRIVHRDLQPSHVLVERGSGRLVVGPPGISVLLERERAHLHDPDVLRKTLPYISPEQTGRIHREVDQRSDLYSLGVILYELLTGRRPFTAAGPAELVHAHLAKRPLAPAAIVDTVPPLLSDLVMRLLEKAPEHRYQSAAGVLADLDRFAAARAGGDHEPSFDLGERDFSPRLQLPHQLYGRTDELARLRDALGQALATGGRRLVVLRGDAGVGKSALARSLEGLLFARSGYMAVGRFEPRGAELPYLAFARAFSGLIEQLLSEADERLALWQTQLRAGLGSLMAVAAAMVPELALVLGELPPLDPVELGEARNRLHVAVSRLLSSVARVAPLVLVIEDLQWADAGSLELLRVLNQDHGGPVLLVATARPEADLGGLLDAATASVIELGPLPLDDLERWLADVLARPLDEVGELAELVGRKTGRSPLFVGQFITHLADVGLLSPSVDGWTWTREAIVRAPIPDDVAALMTARLERLDARDRELLQLAGVIGARFEPGLLANIAEREDSAVAEALVRLEREGLILPLGDGFQFGHERIREAASAMLTAARRRAVHRRIGLQLRAEAAAAGEPPSFAVVDHLDAALDVGESLARGERLDLARLNRDAGDRALATGAWDVARRYFAVAVELLGPELAQARDGAGERALVFAAHFGLAQTTALAAETAEAGRAFDELASWRLSLVEHGQVVARRVRISALQGRMSEALALGLAGLERCGIELPAKPSAPALGNHVVRALVALRGLDRATLAAMPLATDPRALAAMHIITALANPAFILEPTLHLLLTALHVRLIASHGYYEAAPEALAQLAIVVSAMGQTDKAGQLCADARALTQARPTTVATSLRTEAMALLFVGPSHQPFRACADPIELTTRRAVEAGERDNAGYFGALGLALHLEAGTHLRELPELAARLRAENPDWGTREMAIVAELTLRFAGVLSAGEPRVGAHEHPVGEQPPSFMTRAEMAPFDISELTQYASVVVELGGRLLLASCAGRLDAEHDTLWALHESIASDYQRVLLGTWQAYRFAMLSAILVGEQVRRGRIGRARAELVLGRRLLALRKAAAGCAANYGPLAQIVEGEVARLRGQASAAASAYERARELAAEHGMRQVAGLACLRLAALADEQGWRTVADGARALAHASFLAWGAWTLVGRLERTHTGLRSGPFVVEDPPTASPSSGSPHLLSSSSSTSDLDVATVLGTMQLISADLRLDEVVPRVLAAAIENAGADRGALLLERDGELGLVARGQAGGGTEFLAEPVPLAAAGEVLPAAVVRYVLRTGAPAVIDDLTDDPRFANDPYVAQTGARSLLCMPITKQRERVGALVLENRLAPKAFGPERLEVLRILLAQAASALDNARLYAALARSEAQWRSLVDGAPDIIALLDADGRVELVNHLQPFAVEPAQLVGAPVEGILDETNLAAWREAFAAVLRDGGQRELELCVAPPKLTSAELGSPVVRRWYSTRLAAIVADRGRPTKVLAIASDITEHKRLEAQLRQQQRLESIGTLASGVAHEINNPIQGILNYAELLGSRADDRETVLEFAGEIAHESQRVATIVRNLLAFARQEREQAFEVVEVDTILDVTWTLIRAVLRKDQVQLDLDLPAEVPAVRCRPQQIQQVMMNLVTNARDALNRRYPGFDPSKRIEVRVRVPSPGRVRISVSDRGPGIPDEVRAHIFDPFFTTKGRDQGAGLGLSVSHGIVADHGGELTVESELGVGTTFHLDLPAAAG